MSKWDASGWSERLNALHFHCLSHVTIWHSAQKRFLAFRGCLDESSVASANPTTGSVHEQVVEPRTRDELRTRAASVSFALAANGNIKGGRARLHATRSIATIHPARLRLLQQILAGATQDAPIVDHPVPCLEQRPLRLVRCVAQQRSLSEDLRYGHLCRCMPSQPSPSATSLRPMPCYPGVSAAWQRFSMILALASLLCPASASSPCLHCRMECAYASRSQVRRPSRSPPRRGGHA